VYSEIVLRYSGAQKKHNFRYDVQESDAMVQNRLIAQGYSLAEEIANSISHGLGCVFGIVGLVLLLTQAVEMQANITAITSYSLYGGSMILLFLASTLYHAIPHQRANTG
jgi:Predicted membrane protein, hemolysin III homolog